MSANIESFVSAREDAWHKLGTVLDDTFDAETALRVAHLDNWNVRKAPLAAIVNGEVEPVPNRYAIVRDNPFLPGEVDVLGANMADTYRVFQNEELTELLDTLVDESGSSYETAGSLDNGKRVFVTMRMPGHVSIGGVDRVENYLAAMTSHDGSLATTLMVTPVRIVCQNTMNLAFQNNSHLYRVRHTTNAAGALLRQARQAIEFTYDYLDDFQVQADRLVNTELTQIQFEELIHGAFGAPEGAPAGVVTRADNKIDEMARLFGDANTQKEIRHTAWAGLNALTEWSDHFSPVRGTNDVVAARSRKALLDTKFKNQALELMLSV